MALTPLSQFTVQQDRNLKNFYHTVLNFDMVSEEWNVWKGLSAVDKEILKRQ